MYDSNGKDITVKRDKGFTIVELLIVIVVIAILASISIVTYNGIQGRARDTSRITKLRSVSTALELYKLDNGSYPQIQDGVGTETTCGSQTDNWGHCDRLKILTDAIAPYIKIDPTSLSAATQGNYYYSYTSQSSDGYQTYGMYALLEGTGGQNDGGYYANAYEIGPKPTYCFNKYTGTGRDWFSYTQQCQGGN